MATGGARDSIRENAGDFIGEFSVTQSCEPCMKSNISKTATVFCDDCLEYLCDSCKNPHIVYKPGKHNIVGFFDIVEMKGLDRCQEHNKKIKFFCQEHSKLCCNSCLIVHGKCGQLEEIDSVPEKELTNVDDLKHSLIKLDSDADLIIAESKRQDSDLNKSVSKVNAELDAIQIRILKLFKEAQNNVQSEATAFKSGEIKRSQTVCTKVKEDLHTILTICSAIAERGTPQQKYIILKRMEEKNNMIQAEQVTPDLSLSCPRELTSLLEMGKDFIKLQIQKVETSLTSLSSHPRPVTLKLLVSVDLPKTGDDEKAPLLTGLDFLPDGRLVAVDNYNLRCIILNERLQRLGTPYKFKTYPYGVVCVSRDTLCVTVDGKVVCLLSVSTDNTITLTREIKTSSWFFSICCMSPSNMVVSTYNDPRPVRMISVDGVETDFDHILTFPKKTYKVDESACTYVQSKNTLVLTDRYAHTVYMNDTVNDISRAVTNENIQEPCGACVGPGDTVLACSMYNNSIVHLTIHGIILGTYPVDMNNPYSLCVSKDGTRLAVSNDALGNKKLQLYKISPAMS
ncbi:uncharacterized protein LOC127839927 [Dreissena polymorpha]|uniref:B box-type domain-containing protein n=1 Tax=Dreissena polymorpha TaxID=45954 RepID=A0A9D4JB37_DREPO|nr:uncharacterized protein LOC127839927 [Dreissena polymorpha]KAH3801502.1 hypothetical protein DPMN_155155 [Dreissena polymorpha]